jgi:hypothetical protein
MQELRDVFDPLSDSYDPEVAAEATVALVRQRVAEAGCVSLVRRGTFSLSFGAIYLIVGVVVVAINGYFDNLDTCLRIGSAAVAVLLWPLVLFGVDVELK